MTDNVEHRFCVSVILSYVFFGEMFILIFCPFFDWVLFYYSVVRDTKDHYYVIVFIWKVQKKKIFRGRKFISGYLGLEVGMGINYNWT